MNTGELPEAVRRFVAEARVCRLATVDPSGQPHVVPLCPVFDGDRTLYVDVGRNSANARNVAANPRAEVALDEYDEDWSLLRGALLHCDVQVAKGEERDHAWQLIRQKYPQYKEVDWRPRLTLALRIRSWTEWGLIKPMR
ncbi:MAG: nitroreductase/quinone reductase family protein [Dehalococcoidia bacterium]